jgi:hypothetical protein
LPQQRGQEEADDHPDEAGDAPVDRDLELRVAEDEEIVEWPTRKPARPVTTAI